MRLAVSPSARARSGRRLLKDMAARLLPGLRHARPRLDAAQMLDKLVMYICMHMQLAL